MFDKKKYGISVKIFLKNSLTTDFTSNICIYQLVNLFVVLIFTLPLQQRFYVLQQRYLHRVALLQLLVLLKQLVLLLLYLVQLRHYLVVTLKVLLCFPLLLLHTLNDSILLV